MATTPNKASVTTTQAKTRFRLEQNYPISKLTTFGIGGPADWAAFCRSADEVVEAVEFCRRNQLEYFVIGGGSNILSSDKGFRACLFVFGQNLSFHRISPNPCDSELVAESIEAIPSTDW